MDIERKARSGELLAELNANSIWIDYPTNAGWVSSATGSGSSGYSPAYLYVKTGTGASSTAHIYAGIRGLGTMDTYIEWDKKIILSFFIVRQNSDAEATSRVQLKSVTTIGALSNKGIGIKILNNTVYAESYGTALKETQIYTLTDHECAHITIVNTPNIGTEYYINKAFKAIHDTSGDFPTGNSTLAALTTSVSNGVTGGVDVFALLIQPKIWQER